MTRNRRGKIPDLFADRAVFMFENMTKTATARDVTTRLRGKALVAVVPRDRCTIDDK